MLDCLSKREASLLDFVVEGVDTLFQRIHEGQKMLEDKALRVRETPGERLFQMRFFVAQTAFGQLRKNNRIAFSGDQRFEHRAAGDAQHIGRYGSELDVGSSQQLLDAVEQRCALANESVEVAHQLPQLPLSRRGNESGLQETHL